MKSETPPSVTGAPAHEFAMQFSSTPRGAHLARRLTARTLHGWGHPYGSDAHDTVTLITAELASNAVRHGHVPGRDFHLRITASPALIRVEVSDTHTGKRPALPTTPAHAAESGRGLLLVSVLATRWAVADRSCGGPGKTVWAEYALPSALR